MPYDEQDIAAKLDEVLLQVQTTYTALFGLPGQEYTGRIPTLERRVDAHEARIASLENWRWWVAGGIAAIMFGMGLAWIR